MCIKKRNAEVIDISTDANNLIRKKMKENSKFSHDIQKKWKSNKNSEEIVKNIDILINKMEETHNLILQQQSTVNLFNHLLKDNLERQKSEQDNLEVDSNKQEK